MPLSRRSGIHCQLALRGREAALGVFGENAIPIYEK